MATLAAILPSLISAIAPFLLKGIFGGSEGYEGRGPSAGKSITNYDYNQNPLFQQASQTLQNSPYMQKFNPNQYEDLFNQGVAQPAQRYFEQNVLPAQKAQHYNPSGIYGSGLNKAINSGYNDLQGGLNQLRSNYLQQGQQSHAQGQLDSIMQALGLAQAQAGQQHTPIINQQRGWGSSANSLFEGLEPLLQNIDWGNLFNQRSPNSQMPQANNGNTWGNIQQDLQGIRR